MATPKSPQRRRLDELLADGDWHDREPLIAAAAAVVPPGVATRHARKRRSLDRAGDAARAARDGRLQRDPRGGVPPADDIRVGSRGLATKTLLTALRDGAYQQRTSPDGTHQIRRTPQTGQV